MTATSARWTQRVPPITADTPLHQLTDKLCQPVTTTHTRADGLTSERRHRGLRPLDPADAKLLGAVCHGEFLISGFRNRDLRELLFAAATDEKVRRRQAGKVSVFSTHFLPTIYNPTVFRISKQVGYRLGVKDGCFCGNLDLEPSH